jgi:hypothetical protein
VGVGVAVGAGVGVGVGVGAGVGVGVGVGAVTWIETVAIPDELIPSEAWYVNVRVPVNEPPEVKVKLPFALRLSDPFPPPLTRLADRASPSASRSFARTPGAGTVSVTAVVATYESFTATGVAFVTVIVTVAGSVKRMPRLRTRAS